MIWYKIDILSQTTPSNRSFFMSKKKIGQYCLWIICCVVFALIAFSFPYDEVIKSSSTYVITKTQLQKMLDKKGVFVPKVYTVSALDEEKNEKIEEYVIGYKLFNMFKVLSVRVNVVNNDQVYVGGNALGFVLNTKGVVLVGSNAVVTKDGLKDTLVGSDLKIGDVITKLNQIEISTMEDINTLLAIHDNTKPVNVEYIRNGVVGYTTIQPLLDILTNQYKLGLWVKDAVAGVGTLTYVQPDMEYGALGHAIANEVNGQPLAIDGGDLYEADIVGIKKGEVGQPGELMGLFVEGRNQIGDIDSNTEYGVFGQLTDEKILEQKALMSVGGRSVAKPGYAQILSCVEGKVIGQYDIEIIKTNYQSSATEKGMVIRVIDKELLEKTGGIVQGMSGSPIIQEGKIIGAVTHVFVSDPTKGFGLYIDWMLSQ